MADVDETSSLVMLDRQERTCTLRSAVALPRASAFLWNRCMMIQVNCRGFAVAQFMQPEPAKYAHGPQLEAKTFMQPEHAYYANHPGRFVYFKDRETFELFSVPYEPVRQSLGRFEFICGRASIQWRIQHGGLLIGWKLNLATDHALELWTLTVENMTSRSRALSIYPFFPIGYMSWMNQSGAFRPDLNGIVASSITPYQRSEDFDRIRTLKDKTFFLANELPYSWEARHDAFEGEGGLTSPKGVALPALEGGTAHYERPAAVLQYQVALTAGARRSFRFGFGPASTDDEVHVLRNTYLEQGAANATTYAQYANYVERGAGCLHIETPDRGLDSFVNDWLDRQVYFHGELNRLTTDPQTRNYLQDAMGMCYVRASAARAAFLRVAAQQRRNGALPDGILLSEVAQLKYINQVPHTDHCVWLPVCLQAYLDETNDYAILDEIVGFADSEDRARLFEHVHLAVRWLLRRRDARGLSYIEQGDWCDPMNMVGIQGRGVSGWLTLAVAYAARAWSGVCAQFGDTSIADTFKSEADACNAAVNRYLWDGAWFARGITDDGVIFGVSKDAEGQIFLNPQSWAILSEAATAEQRAAIIGAVEQRLETPYGVEMLAPAYSGLREDVGRLTQKYPGSAENGAVYNHASAFYIYALYTIGERERAFRLLRRMIPGPEDADLRQRGQLPVFIPNYYRGAYRQIPSVAGRSSQLANTGTVHWVYRCLVDGLFGLSGCPDGLTVAPQLPKHWPRARVRRRFRGATFDVSFERSDGPPTIQVGGARVRGTCIEGIAPGTHYEVRVNVGPATE